jgi:type IV pilus assembly protein PilV
MTAFRSFRSMRRSPQRGSFMLEALIAILIVALGVLGIVGLYARSVQNVDDSKFRGEAALLVDQLVGQMWISDPKLASLTAKFDSSGSGAEYTEFAALVAQRLPNSIAPVVTVTPGPTATSSNVAITIQWTHPGDTNDPTPRRYDVNAVIGANQ